MKINDYISLLNKDQKEFDENLKRESIKRSMIKENFEKYFEEFRIKTVKSFVDIASNSHGNFTFKEIESQPIEFYSEEDQQESEYRNRRDYNYKYDEKKELIFDFTIKTTKLSQTFTSIIHFFNLDENFSVHIELKRNHGMIETEDKVISFENYMSEDFEEILVELLKELKEK